MKEQPGTCQSHPHLLALTSYIREPRRCPQQLTCAHLCTQPTKGPAVPTLFSSRLSWSFVLFPRILDKTLCKHNMSPSHPPPWEKEVPCPGICHRVCLHRRHSAPPVSFRLALGLRRSRLFPPPVGQHLLSSPPFPRSITPGRPRAWLPPAQ